MFVLLYRVPFDTPRAWVRERRSVHLTNAALVACSARWSLLFGWRRCCWSICRSWWWPRSWACGCSRCSIASRPRAGLVRGDWSFVDAALRGLVLVRPAARTALADRQYRLPPRPSSQSARAQLPCWPRPIAVQALQPVVPLSLARGLTAPCLTLWDERPASAVPRCPR